jgi:lipoic acid synthetase
VEVLIPDFKGSLSSLKTVLESGVDVLNHNMETVSRLYAKIRPEASFSRSLEIFRSTKQYFPKVITKSGVMLGLGETTDEVCWVFERLLESGCDALTLGQYLMPSRTSYPVHEYVRPEQFEVYRKIALRLGFRWVKAGPYVRSSFHADELVAQCEGVMV